MATLDTVFTEHPPLALNHAPVSAPAYASAARTATPAPVIYSVPAGARGVAVVIDMTAVSGSSSVVFTIEGVDRISGKTWQILASAAKTSVAATVLQAGPDLTASSNVVAQHVLPAEIIIRATHGTSDSTTYSVGVHFTA